MKVLDQGSVVLLDTMGSDLSIVQAARMSTGAESKGNEQDAKLIRYLLYNKHTSPFEMVEFIFELECPIVVAWHIVRHRMAEYNFFSGRYSEMPDKFYSPKEWRVQSKSNKQMSGEAHEHSAYWGEMVDKVHQDLFRLYQSMLADGVSREMARLILPFTTYTKFRMKMNAHALMNFLKLRCDVHAQEETRQYALAMEIMFCEKLPMVASAWKDLNNGVPYK